MITKVERLQKQEPAIAELNINLQASASIHQTCRSKYENMDHSVSIDYFSDSDLDWARYNLFLSHFFANKYYISNLIMLKDVSKNKFFIL